VTLRAAAMATAASAALPPFCKILIPISLASGYNTIIYLFIYFSIL